MEAERRVKAGCKWLYFEGKHLAAHRQAGLCSAELDESTTSSYPLNVSTRRYNPVSLPNIALDSCTPGLRRRLLHESPLFRDLDSSAIGEVDAHFADYGYSAGDTIVREGTPAGRFFIVALGIVKLFRHTESGESVLLDVLGSGDHFGSPAGFGPDQYTETAIALSTVCALTIDAEEFRSVLERHSAVALRTVEALSGRLGLAHDMVTQLGRSPAKQRISYVLHRLSQKFGTQWEGRFLISAPLGREEIASMAGTTTETCSRVLSELQHAGLITAGRGWVALADARALDDLLPE